MSYIDALITGGLILVKALLLYTFPKLEGWNVSANSRLIQELEQAAGVSVVHGATLAGSLLAGARRDASGGLARFDVAQRAEHLSLGRMGTVGPQGSRGWRGSMVHPSTGR